MKKLNIVAALFLMVACVATPVLAQNVTNEVHAEQGDIDVLGGIGWGWKGFGISGGVEYIVQKFSIPDLPLSWGVMGLAGLDFGGVDVSAAGMATLHWGMKAYKDFPEFLQNFDWYIGLGFGLGIVPFPPEFGISTGGGVSYSVNDTLAIDLHSFYIDYFAAGVSGFSQTIGVRYALE